MVQNLPGGTGWLIFGVFTAAIFVTTIAIALRAYVRLKLVKGSSEDLVAGIAWLLFTIFNCLTLSMPFHGLGQHTNLVPLTEIPVVLKVQLPCRNILNTTD